MPFGQINVGLLPSLPHFVKSPPRLNTSPLNHLLQPQLTRLLPYPKASNHFQKNHRIDQQPHTLNLMQQRLVAASQHIGVTSRQIFVDRFRDLDLLDTETPCPVGHLPNGFLRQRVNDVDLNKRHCHAWR